MQWLIEVNLRREAGHARLLDALDRMGSSYQLVQTIPSIDALLPGEIQLRASDALDVDTLPQIEVDARRPTFALGSYKLARIVRQRGWNTPGSDFRGLTYPEWAEGWGHAALLNPRAWTGRLGDAVMTGPSFIRPIADDKTFGGCVLWPDSFELWRHRILALEGQRGFASADTLVLVAKPVVIHAEMRFWVIRGEVVTASLYKRGGEVFYSDAVPESAWRFARARVQEWCPNAAFVLDIADTPKGLRVVEVNCLAAAGFYAADMQKIVAAVEAAWPE